MSSAPNFQAINFWTRALGSEAAETKSLSFRLLVPPLIFSTGTILLNTPVKHMTHTTLATYPLQYAAKEEPRKDKRKNKIREN